MQNKQKTQECISDIQLYKTKYFIALYTVKMDRTVLYSTVTCTVKNIYIYIDYTVGTNRLCYSI